MSEQNSNKTEPGDNKTEPKPLNRQQTLFIQEYLKDHNATQAAIRAGYSQATAAQIGSRLLRHVQIKAAIEEAKAEHLARVTHETGITLERTLSEIAKGAFFDPRRLFHPDGRPREVVELDSDTAAVIAGLDVLEEYRGTGEDRQFVGYTKKYKLADRRGYLDMLMKHLGGYSKDNEVKVETTEVLSDAEAARRIAFVLARGFVQQKEASDG